MKNEILMYVATDTLIDIMKNLPDLSYNKLSRESYPSERVKVSMTIVKSMQVKLIFKYIVNECWILEKIKYE